MLLNNYTPATLHHTYPSAAERQAPPSVGKDSILMGENEGRRHRTTDKVHRVQHCAGIEQSAQLINPL